MVQKNSAAPSAPRGRPRSFDTDEVLDRVRDTFWRYGYAGTSMDQLSAATGLHKPSLYGAFGDKKKLYLAALDNYLADVRAEFAEAFAIPDLFESLEAMTEWSIDKFMGKDEAGTGCFMMHTAMPEASEDPEISRAVRESMDSLDRALVRRFEKAIEAGQISAERRSARAGDGDGRQPLRDFRPGAGGLFAAPSCGRWPTGRSTWSGRWPERRRKAELQ